MHFDTPSSHENLRTMHHFVYMRFAKKQNVIVRKSEDTTNIYSLLFGASPKFDWIPVGGGWSGVLDSCSEVNSFREEEMSDLCSIFLEVGL